MNWMNELTAEFEKTFIRDDRYKVFVTGLPADFLRGDFSVFPEAAWKAGAGARPRADSTDRRLCVYLFVVPSFWGDKSRTEFYREPDHLGIGSIRMCHWGTDRFRRDAGFLYVRHRIGG